MYRYRLYNSGDVEKLKRDLKVYKQALESINSGEAFKYLDTQREVYDLKLKLSKLKGEMNVMEESYQEKIAGYEKQEQKVSWQIQNITDSLNQLKQDINLIKGDVEEMRVNELLEKMDLVIYKTDNHLTKVNDQVNSQKEEFSRLKNHMKPKAPKKPTPRPSEYRQLQNMLQSFNHVNQIPNQTKNNITNNSKNYQQPVSMSINQNSRKTKSFGDGQNAVTVSNGKKTFRSSQYELNKNIITRTSTSKNKKRIKDDNDNYEDKNPSITRNDDNPTLSQDNYIEEKVENHTHAENLHETNIEQNNTKETNHLSSDNYTAPHTPDEEVSTKINTAYEGINSTKDTTDENFESIKSDTEESTASIEKQNDNNGQQDDQNNQSSIKKEFASFFNIFRKG